MKIVMLEGLRVDESFTAMPARLRILETGEEDRLPWTAAEVTIQEGKFHQVKRMFEAAGSRVLYLKRISMGELTLDPALSPGQYRKLTEEELRLIGALKGEGANADH